MHAEYYAKRYSARYITVTQAVGNGPRVFVITRIMRETHVLVLHVNNNNHHHKSVLVSK